MSKILLRKMEFLKEKQQHTLCEDKILCDEVLFKHRKPYDKTVPQRGGDKDFSPDDSWLQAKRLEKFYEERRTVLAEPRVDRLGSIVTGEWNPEIQLVELHKEMGKFWSSMGFSDKSRKWLYPEEALFLMETNTLEVWYKGLPVSIQQAYAEFLKSLNFEEYMVYAHLRRIGYVVLRHQGRLLSTKYERKIKLDKHINLKRRKMMSMKQPTTSISDKNLGSVPTKKVKLESDASPFENCSTTMQVDMEREDIPQLSEENGKFLAQSKNQSNSSDCLKKDKNNRNEYDKCINEMGSKNIHPSDGGTCLKNDYKLEAYSSKEGKNFNSTEYSVWNFKDIVFPDVGDPLNVQFGGKVSQNYFPQGIPPFSEKRVDKELVDKLKAKGQKNQRTGVKYGQEVDSFDLLFSYEQPHPAKKIRASNWREYKEKLMEFQGSQSFISPVEHYWRDEVVPLVRPEDAINTISVLKKLQVIPQWEGNPGSLCKTEKNQGLPKVSYDVFKPDAKFRKSNPGVPDHRVCVMRSEEDPPSLSTLTSLYSYYDDDIPIHWAVVDNGEIAFYSFGQISFPTQVFMG